MSFLAIMMMTIAAPAGAVPTCPPSQLRLSLQASGGPGMSHDGITVSLGNTGADCTLPALPRIRFADARGRFLGVVRRHPVGMHLGPAMVPVHLSGGHHATTELRWISGNVFDKSRSVHARQVVVEIGGRRLKAPLSATLYGPSGQTISFEQPPLHAVEGMAKG